MKRIVLGKLFAVLAAFGLAGIVTAALQAPTTLARFAAEPEDTYGLVFWLLVFVALVGAWSRGALLALRRVSPHSTDRYSAWLVLTFGLAFTAAFLLDPVGRSLSLVGLIILASGGALYRLVAEPKHAA
jgi:hypothetical protein